MKSKEKLYHMIGNNIKYTTGIPLLHYLDFCSVI